ncbi:hypothetical protein [Parasphingorhabdus sp.]|uniref:hypothetical protein n=1 Tax=Parasphingorhabdus sp. TaxID=2709688 RepID=UPI0035938737
MSKILDELLKGGPHHKADKIDGGASVRPVSGSESDLIAFQPIAERIIRNAGDGFSIYKELRSSDHAVDYYLVILLTIENDAK